MVIDQFPARFGKFILLDRLASGGMAEVFRAKVIGAEHFEKLIAIKCMLPQLLEDTNFINMFIDEAKLAAQLNHANIVQIYELGRLDERLYIAMELVNGRDVRHLIRACHTALTTLPVGFAAYVVSKAAEGLDFAHRKTDPTGRPWGLVHRDVSPQNILVSYDGEVKVVDFGIAKAEARITETQAGVLKGKFAYMAPEQVTGDPIDHRADIFALGAVLYEMLVGKRLFVGDNDLSVLEQVRQASLPEFQTTLPASALVLEPVLRRALARKPKNRYQYAAEMAEDLQQVLIEKRTIFGAKRATEYMKTLCGTEIHDLQQHMQRFSQINLENCVISIEGNQSGDSATLVFNKTFGKEQRSQSRPKVKKSRASSLPHTPPVIPTHTKFTALRLLRLVSVMAVVMVVLLAGLATALLPKSAWKNVNSLADMKHELSALVFTCQETTQHWLKPWINWLPIDWQADNQFLPEKSTNDAASADIAMHPEPKEPTAWLMLKTPAHIHGRVWIDEQEVGKLPLPNQKLQVGSHDVLLQEETSNGKILRIRHFQVMLGAHHTKKVPYQLAVP